MKSSTKIGMNIILSLRSKRKLRAVLERKANHKRYDQSTISFSAHGYRADAPRRARSTSIRACSRTTSFSSGLRSTTWSPTSSSRRCCSSNRRTRTGNLAYINSPGGSVTAGMAIYDTMQFVRCPVTTFCIGQCASMAAVVDAGTMGGVSSNSRILIHQPRRGILSQSDIKIAAEEILRRGAHQRNSRLPHNPP